MRNIAAELPNRPIGIDLFAGAGGLSLGFEQSGFNVVAAVEVDPIHAAAHSYNFPQCATICASVVGLSAGEIRRRAGIGDRSIDVVFGGAPCQGFSLIGKRVFDDPRNRLVGEFVRLVVELNAKYFVFENVKGLTVGRHRQFLDEVIQSFEQSGYDVVRSYEVLNAKDYGVPQSRERLFLLGAKRGLPLPAYPKGKSTATVGDALLDLPNADDFRELLLGDSVQVAFSSKSSYARKLRGQLRDSGDYSRPRQFDAGLLTSSTRTVHTPLSIRRFKATEPGHVEPVSRFLKLALDGISNTLRAGTDSARGAFTSPRPIHPIYPRVITVREAARLHSYPDWFRFHVTKWHGFRQIGNSVPPLLGRAIGRCVIQALGAQAEKEQRPSAVSDTSLLSLDMAQACQYFDLAKSPIKGRDRKPAELNQARADYPLEMDRM